MIKAVVRIRLRVKQPVSRVNQPPRSRTEDPMAAAQITLSAVSSANAATRWQLANLAKLANWRLVVSCWNRASGEHPGEFRRQTGAKWLKAAACLQSAASCRTWTARLTLAASSTAHLNSNLFTWWSLCPYVHSFFTGNNRRHEILNKIKVSRLFSNFYRRLDTTSRTNSRRQMTWGWWTSSGDL